MARARNKKLQASPVVSLTELDGYLARAQIAILGMAILIVPLIVLPESNFVDITSVPKTSMLRIFGSLQATILLSRGSLIFTSRDNTDIASMLAPIRASRPALYILGSVLAVVVVSVISTLFSIVPHQSWWGRNPAGFESGEFSALMYMILMVSVVVTIRESTRSELLWRTLAITGVLASLVGFLQFLGMSPLDISATQGERITGTNGNPIFFGSMLIMLVPITLAVLLDLHEKSKTKNWQRVWLDAIAVFTFLASASLFATVSRGPWLGALVGGIVALSIVGVFGRPRVRLAPSVTIVVFIAVGGLVALLISPTSTASQPSPEISSAITKTSTVNTRFQYWAVAADMAVGRDPIPFTKTAPKAIRWLFGYGPDSFRYAGTFYLDEDIFTRRLTTAHSDPVNRLAEQGFLGLLAWIGLWAAIFNGVVNLIGKARSSNSSISIWIVAAIAAALTGRFAEQMFGSPTPGDMLVFWMIVGGLVALLLAPSRASEQSQAARPTNPPTRYVAYLGVTLIAAVGMFVAWEKGASYLVANQTASFLNRSDTVPADDGIKRLKTAAKLAPDDAFYLHGLADIEFGRAESTQDNSVRIAALTLAYEHELQAHELNPVEIAEIYDLAFASWELGNAGRPELLQATIDLYERLTVIAPEDSLARERLEALSELATE